VTETAPPFNPFPGLRPYEPDEDYLFFGRDEEVDELQRRLRTNRFLAVVGSSGCGKSSLVRSGLIPTLHSGTVVRMGSSWRVAILRPGEDPIGHLASALAEPGMIGAPTEELASTNRVLLDAALRRGARGLVEAVRNASLAPSENVLIVVDQFEELFRFRQSDQVEQSRDETTAFVKLLLAATSQDEIPIYVVLTMRADFIGECVEYQGLPEAFNAGQYLIPRLSRDEMRAAITGPVAVGGGKIASRLVIRILNDLGSDQDQLPVLQHALMRTWDHWRATHAPGEPMDIVHYEAIGTMRDALSRHAEEAFREVGAADSERVAEQLFKALTDTATNPRGTRRPCSISQLAAIAGATEPEVTRIVEIFRRAGRSFLMPPPDVALTPDVIVDLSHESLMRCWTRLIGWTEEERASATMYLRLSKASVWFTEGSAGLWRDPELELGLRWKRQNRPSSAWASRYDTEFDRAMTFLARSEEARDRERAERIASRRRQWRQLQVATVVFFTVSIIALWGWLEARKSYKLADLNLKDAEQAVKESLQLIDPEPSSLGIDHAEIIDFRRQLATKAKVFYREFIKRGYKDESIREATAAAHFGLGHADRVLGDRAQAAQEYTEAIEQYGSLASEFPRTARYRSGLANANTFLGETLRLSPHTYDLAEKAYGQAMRLQEALRREYPQDVTYPQDLARTHYNRGILLSNRAWGSEDVAGATRAAEQAASDFRAAIRLLEPLVEQRRGPAPSQGLSRALNNLGILLAQRSDGLPEAQKLITRAVALHEGLRTSTPENRELSIELAKFYNNLADVQLGRGDTEPAAQSNDRAITLIDGLAQPAPSLLLDRADGYAIRGSIRADASMPRALEAYREGLASLERVAPDRRASGLSEFHDRFGELLRNVAALGRAHAGAAEPHDLLLRAVASYLAIADRIVSSGTADEARWVLENMSELLMNVADRDRVEVVSSYTPWEPRLRARAAVNK